MRKILALLSAIICVLSLSRIIYDLRMHTRAPDIDVGDYSAFGYDTHINSDYKRGLYSKAA